MIKNTLKQTKFEDKTVKSTQFSLVPVVLLASMISRSFQTVRRTHEAWKPETFVRSQSFSSESAVKNLHVRRRKIQISPPLREQDQSNPLPMPCPWNPPPPPRRHDIDRCIRLSASMALGGG